MNIEKFQKIIWEYYRNNKRDLPWRKTRDPYKILVSEMMLQQTQASRVEPKYKSFVKKFPTVTSLAHAKLSLVLGEWQGLGYNRRALYLKKSAEIIEKDFKGKFPKDFKILCSLPGVGPATAGDIMAFAWNVPVVIIETNIRSVFLHFFFKGKEKVTDKEIIPLIEKALSEKINNKNPREWYYALFDYGVYLKRSLNPSRRSAHHATQSKFSGSYRQKRAEVLRTILGKSQNSQGLTSSITKKEIQNILQYEPKILSKILFELENEGFLKKVPDNSYTIL